MTSPIDDIVAALDLTDVGSPATRQVYVAQPDMNSPGGLKQLGPLLVSPDAEAYRAPFQK